MFFLILTIASSTSIALILKYSSVNKGNAVLLLASNYFVGAALGYIIFITDSNSTYSISTLLAGAIIGLIFVSTFFAFSKSIDAAGTALATLSSRISLFIPVALSIIFFGEVPTTYHLIGFVLAAITIYLFSLSLRRDKDRTITVKDLLYLSGLLVGVGLGDFSLKIYQQTQPIAGKQFFIFSIFLFAFIYSAAIVVFKRIPLQKKTIISGAILGLPNVMSSVFLIGALESIAAILVYPIVNIGVILLTALFAFIIWKEKLNRIGIFSLITGFLAIILLTL